MMFLQTQLRTVAFFLVLHAASANVFSTFRFSRLLYAFNLCTHESGWCPAPPCDLRSFREPICQNYICRKVEPRGKECVFIGNCNGDEKCIKTAQYLGLDEDYYAETFNEETTEQSYATTADGTDVTDSFSTSASGKEPTTSVARSWLPYAILGSIFGAFVILTAWKRRRAIGQGALSEELAPKSTKSIKGAIARRQAKTQVDCAMA